LNERAPQDVTRLLRAYSDGDRDALDQILPLVYDDLRRIARAHLSRGRHGHTMHTTGLVHEAYLRLVDQKKASWEDRQHFLSVCARAMRQIIVSNARKHAAKKRGGGDVRVTWDEGQVAGPERHDFLLALDEALDRLARHDERLARVVECRFFAGLTEEETAEAVGASLRTVQRDWTRARAWLREDLET
jgi:RNA polymerase sigma factor (TIGR02999 family)